MDSNSFSERFFFNFKNEVQQGKVETMASQSNPIIKPLWIVHFLF